MKASESARPYEPEKNPAIRRLTAGAIKRRKGKTLFPIATAYDAPFGQFVERAGIDVILVGDSVGNVVLGFRRNDAGHAREHYLSHAGRRARNDSRAYHGRHAVRLVSSKQRRRVAFGDSARQRGRRVLGETRGRARPNRPHSRDHRRRDSGRRPHRRDAANRRARPGLQNAHPSRPADRRCTRGRSRRRLRNRARSRGLRDLSRDYRDVIDSDDRHRLGPALRFAGARAARYPRDVSALAELLPNATRRSGNWRRKRWRPTPKRSATAPFPARNIYNAHQLALWGATVEACWKPTTGPTLWLSRCALSNASFLRPTKALERVEPASNRPQFLDERKAARR